VVKSEPQLSFLAGNRYNRLFMLRRRWFFAAIPLVSCRTAPPPLVLPPTIAEVWHLKDSSVQPAATAPDSVRSIGIRG
jgi:hypothetical protein